MANIANSYVTEDEALACMDGFDGIVHLPAGLEPLPYNEKPECIGCGYCCSSQPCWLAFIGQWWNDGQCEFLVWNGARYQCALIDVMKLVSDHLPESTLGTGMGCDGNNGQAPWRDDVRKRTRVEILEIRALAHYEDGTVDDLLDEVCGPNNSLRAVVLEFISTIERLLNSKDGET